MLETDSSDVLNECIKVVKKGGNVSLIADYVGYSSYFSFALSGWTNANHVDRRSQPVPDRCLDGKRTSRQRWSGTGPEILARPAQDHRQGRSRSCVLRRTSFLRRKLISSFFVVAATVIITHGNKDLEDAPHLYDIFDRKTDHCIKCVMRTPFGRQQRMSIYDSAAETKAAA